MMMEKRDAREEGKVEDRCRSSDFLLYPLMLICRCPSPVLNTWFQLVNPHCANNCKTYRIM